MHESAMQVKQTMVALIQSSKLSGEYSYKLFLSLFGPNANIKFSLKKNIEFFKILTHNFTQEEIKIYFEHLKQMFESPNVEEVFGAATENEEMEDKSDDEEN